ncbi:probable G-protein coupled receptor 139 [Calliphora vicina]|uniref:probable G-protein coupled receptor 139 n=1 Tax=Calliphora vicina TaxID=7373 RepID=UPI00325A6C1E
MAVNESEPLYCGSGMDNFHTSYKNLHGYISLIVCILGTIANTLNIIVLTRREMRSPTNAILTGLAVADLAVMLEYIPYTVHDYILWERLPREQQLSYPWACFIKFHSIFAQVLHTISIWLTVTLAVWRYIAVGYPQKNRQWCGMRTTIITITSAYVVCVLVVSPSFYLITSIAEFLEMLDVNGKTVHSIPLSQYGIELLNETAMAATTTTTTEMDVATNWHNVTQTTAEMLLSTFNSSIKTTTTTSTTSTTTTIAPLLANNASGSMATEVVRNITVYRLYHSDLALRNKSLLNATFLIYSVLIKLIPCIALTILSVRLIMALLEAKRRRKMLTSNAANGMKPIVNGKVVEQARPRKNSKTLEKEKQTDRTTKMLLAVLLLFLITEFPQGIMGLLNMVLGDAFLMQCYLRLSDLMDILALINSSINFILYCSMSRQFRTTFTLLFRPKFLDKWLPVAQDDETMGGGGGGVGGATGRAGANSQRQGGSGSGGRTNGIQRDMISKSVMGEQNFNTTTQVTNV